MLDGEVPTQDPEPDKNFKKLMALADKFRRLNVRTNADTPGDAEKAREFGAQGHRPVPDRAHVLRARADRPDAGDDPLR